MKACSIRSPHPGHEASAARLALLILALLPVAGCGSPEDRALERAINDDGMKLMATAHDDARARLSNLRMP